MAINSKAQLNDAEKLAYLRDVLKDGPARHVAEGLSKDTDYYKEAIGCFQRHYGHLQLIHQPHFSEI